MDIDAGVDRDESDGTPFFCKRSQGRITKAFGQQNPTLEAAPKIGSLIAKKRDSVLGIRAQARLLRRDIDQLPSHSIRTMRS